MATPISIYLKKYALDSLFDEKVKYPRKILEILVFQDHKYALVVFNPNPKGTQK